MSGISGYKLEEPTELDAVAALTRVFGADSANARWTEACVEALLLPGMVKPGAALGRAAAALAVQGGSAAMVARSIEIRMRTYYRLLERTLPSANQARP